MKVHRDDVQAGCILEDDVMGMTVNPIIPKQTILTDEHIKILRAFNITEVTIEKTRVDGRNVRPKTSSSAAAKTDSEEVDSEYIYEAKPNQGMVSTYLNSVEEFKKEFINWQSGMPINLAKIREITLPLIDLMQQNRSIIYSLNQYSTKKEYIYHHPVSVGVLSAMIGKRLGLNSGQINQLAMAGILADCGMSKVSSTILNKERPLSEHEFQEIKLHTANGYKMVKDSPLLKPEAKLAIFQHHERFDGTGYPTSEKSDRIHLYSQIIGIADVFHAMTSERLYRSKQPIFKVLDMISRDLFGKFDIKVVNALIGIAGDLDIGTAVRLSSGDYGEVVYKKANAFTKPIIRLNNRDELLDLSKERNIYITEVLG
ncbi:HD-GYP domain-containing protein [Rossellomorea aquimaris]|uniref:HD-GYP domain-containing protein n=1 Tax=Rossellomorea aquimaris TaxID=189382 RepID=UPI001CD66218|nr:HD-GYP domain-containing protein [Rossellomorea aquimaris]MCA1054874.1 HD-GYP domain-containing protein [Rossellomorea aquimaris]